MDYIQKFFSISRMDNSINDATRDYLDDFIWNSDWLSLISKYGYIMIFGFILYQFRFLFTEKNLEHFIVFIKLIGLIVKYLISIFKIFLSNSFLFFSYIINYFKIKFYFKLFIGFIFGCIFLPASFLFSSFIYIIIPSTLIIYGSQLIKNESKKEKNEKNTKISKRKKQVSKTMEQIEILNKWTVFNSLSPSREDIIELANQTNLNESQIKYWFNDFKKKLK